jgi:sugar/nucleoside kinase (ribokinase family)
VNKTSDLMQNDNLVPEGNQIPANRLSGDVVCFGFLTHCLLLMVDDLPPKNGGAFVRDLVDTVGDDAAIVASILTNWRVPTRLITSPVGNDYHGEKVLAYLASWGADVEHRVSPGLTTPLEIGIVDGDGGRTYFQRRERSALAALKAPSPAQLAGAGLLYVDWYDGPSVLAAMETAFSLDVPVFLNLESQYNRTPSPSDLLRYVTICQVSMDEPGASGSPVDTARSLINLGMETVLVTLGAGGCLVAQGQQVYCIKPPLVKVVDCYGAGAAFSAGIICGLRSGWSLASSARFAIAYAGLKCQVAGIADLSVAEIQETAATLDVRPFSL